MQSLTPIQVLALALFAAPWVGVTAWIGGFDLMLYRLFGRDGTMSRAMDLIGTPPVIAGLGAITGLIFVGLATHFWADVQSFGVRPLYYVGGLAGGGLLGAVLVHKLGLY